MNKISKLLNPNSKQYWENRYRYQIGQQLIRSDGEGLRRFIPDNSVQTVMSFQVLEHTTEYKLFMDQLGARTAPGSTLLISVPVKGVRDRNPQHVNKLILKSMFKILSGLGEVVHIVPRTYSTRSGILATDYFYIEKPGYEPVLE